MDPKTQQAIVVCLTWRRCEHPVEHFPIAAKFFNNEVAAVIKEHNWDMTSLADARPDLVEAIGDIIALRSHAVITAKHAKDLLAAMVAVVDGSVIDHLIASKMLVEADSSALEAMVRDVIVANPKVAGQLMSGNTRVLGFVVGQVMKQAGGKADPAAISKIATDMLVPAAA